jgi:thioredoxin reductase (NADPH)
LAAAMRRQKTRSCWPQPGLPRIRLALATKVLRILGTEQVTGVEMNCQGANYVQEASGVLVRIGVAPNSELFRGQLETDANGYLAVNVRQQTSVSNVFAIGDLANPCAPTVAGAVGAGATAAKVLAEALKA